MANSIDVNDLKQALADHLKLTVKSDYQWMRERTVHTITVKFDDTVITEDAIIVPDKD